MQVTLSNFYFYFMLCSKLPRPQVSDLFIFESAGLQLATCPTIQRWKPEEESRLVPCPTS